MYEPGMRECRKCRTWLPVEEFRMLRQARRRLRERASVCELCECLERETRIRRRRALATADAERRRRFWEERGGSD